MTNAVVSSLDEVMEPIELASTSNSRLQPMIDWYAELLDLDPDRIGANYLSGPKQVSPRLHTPGLIGHDHPELVVVVVPELELVDPVVRTAENLVTLKYAYADTLVVQALGDNGWDVAAIVHVPGAAPGESLANRFPTADVVRIPYPTLELDDLDDAEPRPRPKVRVDERIRRMIISTIASSRAIILVGPPGTGKTTLLREIIDEISHDPLAFGFRTLPNPKWVTPNDSWTTRDLVGGETVDDEGRIRFRPGHLLDAIEHERWLVLDEANRADMDKIFGPLLTWLSGQPVEVGRASTSVDSPPVELTWRDEPQCEVTGAERLAAEDVGLKPIRYSAGADWRILGTYNAVDAQRVFRLGQALGRRFVRVPIPPMSADDFRKVLKPLTEGMSKEVFDFTSGSYQAHLEWPQMTLGPAMFLMMPEYVRATQHDGSAGVVASKPELAESLAEAYLLAVGPWLALLDPDELSELKANLELTDDQWEWIESLLPSLR